MKKWIHFQILTVLTWCLVACGGGGSDTANSTAPSVNAGIDQTVNEQLGATVSATGYPAGGSYNWIQTSGPVIDGFPSTEQEVPITVPAVKQPQTIGLQVEYITTDGQIVTDSVNIDVIPINRPPVAIATMTLPSSNPIAPQSTVVLDASSSFDNDADGLIVSYNWQQLDGSSPVSMLNGTDKQTFNFLAPQITELQALDFRLTVTDDEGAAAEVDIRVDVDPNLTVINVDAGADQVVNEQQSVTLTALGDPDGGTYTWTQLTGDAINNFPATAQNVQFITPVTKLVKSYDFRVQYTSPNGFVDYDQVRITVNPVNLQPTALIRVLTPDILPAQPNVRVTLDGSGSIDTDGNIVSYSWAQVSGPVTIIPDQSSTPAEYVFTTPVRDTPQSYVFMLTVVDDEGGQGTFEIAIDVEGTTDLIVAEAGADQIVDEFDTVSLDGSASYSVVSAVTCSWQALSGPTISFNDPNSCLSSFVAPNVDIDTEISLQLRVTNSQNDIATDTTKVTVKPIALGLMVDSGQVECYNQNAVIACGDSSFPRQDAEEGRDHVQAFLDKIGTGDAGFDYTKLDSNGDELPNDATDYFCLRDNLTGLIWERKTISTDTVPNTPLRDNKNTYSWMYPDGSTGGEDGSSSPAQTICPSLVNCDLETYVIEVNNAIYCGGSNWRVPTLLELQTLLNFAQGSSDGMVDTNIFADLPSETLQNHLYYWTSETSADGGDSLSAWVINFMTGNDNSLPKSSNAYVRLVRTP